MHCKIKVGARLRCNIKIRARLRCNAKILLLRRAVLCEAVVKVRHMRKSFSQAFGRYRIFMRFED